MSFECSIAIYCYQMTLFLSFTLSIDCWIWPTETAYVKYAEKNRGNYGSECILNLVKTLFFACLFYKGWSIRVFRSYMTSKVHCAFYGWMMRGSSLDFDLFQMLQTSRHFGRFSYASNKIILKSSAVFIFDLGYLMERRSIHVYCIAYAAT